MSLSLFVLALYIFLDSANRLGWFAIDPKLIAWVGIVFVAVVVYEAVTWARGTHPAWFGQRRV